ncbi:signal recognition particle, SRP9/SRP14 subunit [Glonium stellatum]|uniref:Signal recognition particle subunit SRP14 n=1 Tax=Glonium stellatum TaxID=574774 RepID=A0A8E2F6I4_9PEZI|nr:signal recognition particle, SRP9/SRP14 subunit [Glonium stellatum]
MVGEHLSNEEFFTGLSELFDSNRAKSHGSIFLTQRRLQFSFGSTASTPTKTADNPLWDTRPQDPLPIIVRATNSKSTKKVGGSRKSEKRIKLSTIVQPEALDRFYLRYAELCKAGMSALKKRDRSKRKKDKAKKRKAGDGEKKG